MVGEKPSRFEACFFLFPGARFSLFCARDPAFERASSSSLFQAAQTRI